MKYSLIFLLGALVGAAVALLYAPSSDEELRKSLASQAETQYSRVQDEVQKSVDKMSSDLQSTTSRSIKTG